MSERIIQTVRDEIVAQTRLVMRRLQVMWADQKTLYDLQRKVAEAPVQDIPLASAAWMRADGLHLGQRADTAEEEHKLILLLDELDALEAP